MNYKYYLPEYFSEDLHPITISLIGVGGTGSQMLTNLARIHVSLVALGWQGLYVKVYDPDIVEEHNIGKQLFHESEIGLPKAIALTNRINNFFKTSWIGFQEKITEDNVSKIFQNNILISCTDNIQSRVIIQTEFRETQHGHDNHKNYLWVDIGNGNDYGQVVIGARKREKVKKTSQVVYLPSSLELFPDMVNQKEDEEPSCSLAESLAKQDLFINSIMANYASNMLWKLFQEKEIDYHGIFLNLKTIKTSKIKIRYDYNNECIAYSKASILP